MELPNTVGDHVSQTFVYVTTSEGRSSLPFRASCPRVVADLRIVGPQLSDQLDFDRHYLGAGAAGGFPEDLLAGGEVPPLLRGEVPLDESALDAAKVGEGVCEV